MSFLFSPELRFFSLSCLRPDSSIPSPLLSYSLWSPKRRARTLFRYASFDIKNHKSGILTCIGLPERPRTFDRCREWCGRRTISPRVSRRAPACPITPSGCYCSARNANPRWNAAKLRHDSRSAGRIQLHGPAATGSGCPPRSIRGSPPTSWHATVASNPILKT
jgi:hypothetical protein